MSRRIEGEGGPSADGMGIGRAIEPIAPPTPIGKVKDSPRAGRVIAMVESRVWMVLRFQSEQSFVNGRGGITIVCGCGMNDR